MKTSLWKRVRIWWHTTLRDLTREEAADLLDGIDLGDREIHMPPLRLAGRRRSPHGPACPGLPTLEDLDDLGRPEPSRGQPKTGRPYGLRPGCAGLPTAADLERMDREYQAGGERTDAVVRGVLRDLRSPPPN